MMKLAWYSFLEQLKKSMRPVKILYLILMIIILWRILDYREYKSTDVVVFLVFINYIIDGVKQYSKILYLIPKKKSLQGYYVFWSYFIFLFQLLLLSIFLIAIVIFAPAMLNQYLGGIVCILIVSYEVTSIRDTLLEQLVRKSKWKILWILAVVCLYGSVIYCYYIEKVNFIYLSTFFVMLILEISRFKMARSVCITDYGEDLRKYLEEKKKTLADKINE
ncbi:hypothetical protein lbkm_4240 [Lachnospiraceae bacterium KM106-2]|nr:hypothetical protein lbkm_4240 [Lachnospiraceae bacterium KM106-2]